MKKLPLFLAISLFLTLTSGCRRGLDDKEQSPLTITKQVIPGGTSAFETQEQTSPEALQASIQEALSSVLAIRTQKIRAQSLPIIPGLPDFKDRFISLTSTLSPVLAQVPGTTLAENIDFAALINNFSLTDEQLQTLIKDAKGILVNLKDLSLVSLKANPVFKAVLSAKVPIIFENQSALVDFNNNWTTNEAAQEAEKMAAAVGLGVEGQISILLPTDIDGEFEIALIGATGKNLLENLSKTLEASDMAEDGSDFETPQPVEPTESAPDKILASRTDENSFLTMDGYSNGAFSSYYYRGYKVGEWKKSYWKPDKNQNQRFRRDWRSSPIKNIIGLKG